MNALPLPKGTSKAKAYNFDPKEQLVLDRIDKAATLKDLENDFIFFTHAVFMVYGHLFDPIAAFIQQHKISGLPFNISTDHEIFTGLTSEWNRRIIGISKEGWEPLSKYLDSVGICNKKKRIFFRALRQRIPIVDVLSLSKVTVLPDKLPMIDIFVYGLDGNKNCIHFKPALNPPLDLPQVIVDEPFQETTIFANKLFNTNS